MKFRVCECCGANLDPGEPCDCQKDTTAPERGSHRAALDIGSDRKERPGTDGQQETTRR